VAARFPGGRWSGLSILPYIPLLYEELATTGLAELFLGREPSPQGGGGVPKGERPLRGSVLHLPESDRAELVLGVLEAFGLDGLLILVGGAGGGFDVCSFLPSTEVGLAAS
jgi:hypothetical protein